MKVPGQRIPSTSALQAFEAAARLCNFSRAAEELEISRPTLYEMMSKLGIERQG